MNGVSLVSDRTVSLSDDIRAAIDQFCGPLPAVHAYFTGRLSAARGTRVREITYLSDGLKVKGWLLVPKAPAGTRLPCVIVNRGGNRDWGAWGLPEVFTYLLTISSWGYVVAASQYRGSAGGEGRDELGGGDVSDVLNLIPLLETLETADVSRLGMTGTSRGGLMTYLALTRTDRVRGAVITSGVSDLMAWESQRPDMADVFRELVGGTSAEVPEAFRDRSPVLWPERLCKTTPLLLLHGAADRRVPAQQALAMAEALLGSRHPFRLVLFDGAGHSLIEAWEEHLELTRAWLDRFVRDGAALPVTKPHDP